MTRRSNQDRLGEDYAGQPNTHPPVRLGPNSPLRSKSKKLHLGFSESQMQKAAVTLLVGDRLTNVGMTLKYPDLALLYAIPNQRASKGEAGRMKGEGVLKGMPDLCFPALRVDSDCGELIWAYGALYTEVKLEGGHPTSQQRAVHRMLRGTNQAVVVCRSVEAIVEAQTIWAAGDVDAISAMLNKYAD